jgi:hypothetical protein
MVGWLASINSVYQEYCLVGDCYYSGNSRLGHRLPAEALPLGEAASATHQTALGENHPWTKDSARVTADALEAVGRAEEAAALRARYGDSRSK